MMKSLLERAVQSGQMLEMIYQSKGNEISQRRIKVLLVKKDSFQALCYKRGQLRIFLINNVLSVLPVRNSFNMGA